MRPRLCGRAATLTPLPPTCPTASSAVKTSCWRSPGAFASFSDYIEINEETGEAIVKLSDLTPDHLDGLAEYTVETVSGPIAGEIVKKVRFKMGDKKSALDSLARHFGMFNDKLDISGEVSLVERLQAGRARANKRNAKPEDDS